MIYEIKIIIMSCQFFLAGVISGMLRESFKKHNGMFVRDLILFFILLIPGLINLLEIVE
jgi:hypothetical protein